MKIQVRNIHKSFDLYPALHDVSVEFPSSELVALLGPSGSGKTTLLRVIAGMEVPESGSVLFGDEDVTARPIRERNVGFVFQNYALFQHMTVEDNIGFGLRVRGVSRARIRERAKELLALMQLEGLGQRLPSQLSGGQQQRVALARALAPEPKVLLLDEPFGALDARVRQELRTWLRRLHDEIHVTSVFVTHDQEEAFEVADQVVIMNLGRVEQVGSPDEVFDRPANSFVMDFIGNVNVVSGRVDSGQGVFGPLTLPHEAAQAVRNDEASKLARSGRASAYIRSQDLVLSRVANGTPHMEAVIAHVRRVGLVVRVAVRGPDEIGLLTAELPYDDWVALGLERGDRVIASVRRARIFPLGGSGPV